MSATSQQFPGLECSVCGALKRDVNHWWIVSITTVLASTGRHCELSITAWKSNLAAHKGQHPTCGSNCTHKLVERWLITGKLDAPRGAAGDPVPTGGTPQ